MTKTISIRDIDTGIVIELSLKSESKIEDIIISAADYWNKNSGAYIIKCNDKILPGEMTIADANFKSDTILELLPDPEGG